MDLNKFLYLWFVVVVVYVECAENSSVKDAEESNVTAISEKKPSHYSLPFLPEDINWKNNLGQSLVMGGVLISSLAALGGLAWMLTPNFGNRVCALLGNCKLTSVSYSNGGNLQDPSQSSNFADMYNTPIVSYIQAQRKRSLNTIGPIFKTLVSAYEKYEHASPTKKD